MKINRIISATIVFALLLSLFACNKGTVTLISSNGPDESVSASHDNSAYIDFALRLVKSAAAEKNGNVAVSPYSVLSALSVIANGAAGESLSQIETASGYKKDALRSEARYLSTEAEDGVIKLSNSLFIREGLRLSDSAYTADVSVYSASAGKNTVKFINSLCSNNTNGAVKKATDSFDGTDMMILSTLLFDSAWSEIYEEKDIKTRNFKNYDGTETEVKILCSKENIITNDEYIGFNKTYKNERYCFTAVMPKDESVDIYDFLESIDAAKWARIYADRKGVMVAVRFPEFSLDCGAGVKDTLGRLGITDVFDEDKADLSGLTAENCGLSELIEGTRVEINRKGTGVMDSELFKERGTEALPDYDLIFADRPFVFAVTDETTLMPIYIGVVANMETALPEGK